MTQLNPMDSVNGDFGCFKSTSYLVFADRCSGFLFCRNLSDQTSSTAVAFIVHLCNTYGIIGEVRMDNGLAFRNQSTKSLSMMGITHLTCAPYCPSGNCLTEKAMGTNKSHLPKLSALKGDRLQQLLSRLNSTPSSLPSIGSAWERFFGRNSRLVNIP